jgi:hypothetical protein
LRGAWYSGKGPPSSWLSLTHERTKEGSRVSRNRRSTVVARLSGEFCKHSTSSMYFSSFCFKSRACCRGVDAGTSSYLHWKPRSLQSAQAGRFPSHWQKLDGLLFAKLERGGPKTHSFLLCSTSLARDAIVASSSFPLLAGGIDELARRVWRV